MHGTFTRGVIQFDLSDIPEDVYLTDAEFSLFFIKGDSSPDSINTNPVCSLFTLTKKWVGGEVTWINADASTEWENTDPDTRHDLENDACDIENHTFKGGGDFNPSCICIQPCNDQPASWEHYTITGAMRDIIKNQDSHYGFFLKPYRGNTGRDYCSSDTTDISLRPKLRIEYSTAIIHTFSAKAWDNSITVTTTSEAITFSIPFTGNYTVSLLTINGKDVVSLEGNGKRSYRIPTRSLSSGMHIISISLGEKREVSKFLFIR